MPTVPRLTNTQVSATPYQPTERRALPSGFSMAGDALKALGQIGQQVYQYDRQQKLTALNAATTQEMDQAALELETDRNFDTQVDRFRARAGEIATRVQKETRDPRLYRLWQAEFGAYAQRKEIDIQRNALKGKIGEQRAGNDEILRLLAQRAGENPQQDAEVLERGLNALNEGYAAGIYTPEEFQAGAAKWRSEVTVAGVRKRIERDPEAAERALLAGEFPDLSGSDRVVWIERASAASDSIRRQRLAEEDRAFRLQERAQKQREESFAKEGDQLAARGQLTPEWIERNRESLSPQDLRYFYRRVTGDEVTTNVRVYTDLREKAGRGEDVRGAARDALTNGQIKPADYDRLIGVVEREGGDGYFRRGSGYIERALKPSDVNPDPAAPQRYAQAIDDWYEWAKKNPGATDEQAETAYKRIVNEYALLNWKDLTLTKRAPQFLVGDRNAPDLAATEQATVEAFEQGRISRDELDAQAALLDEWREAFDRLQQQAPAPKAK